MSNVGGRRFVFRQSSGKVLSLYYKEDKGIALSILNKSSAWLTPHILVENAYPGFDACMDSADNVHILYQDIKGNIRHLVYNSKGWESEVVLNTKRPDLYDKYLHITDADGKLYFFYVLEHSGSRLFSFQSVKGHKVPSIPKVIDYVDGNINPYKIIRDSSNNLHAFYKYAYGSHNQIGYKVYIPSRETWSEFVTISRYNSEDDNELLAASSDAFDGLHVCWQRYSSQKYELVYNKKSSDGSQWSSETVLAASDKSFAETAIYASGRRVIVFWLDDGDIMHCISEDSGKTWKTVLKYDFSPEGSVQYITYSSNLAGETPHIYCSELPGCIEGGLKLAFINDRAEEKLQKPGQISINADTSFLDQVTNTFNGITRQLEELDGRLRELDGKQHELKKHLESLESKLSSTTLLQLSENKEHVHKVKVQENASADENRDKTAGGANTPRDPGNLPVMTGTGFAGITSEYLKKLSKR